jgi:5'-deoxynucleotidase YfbR-like HD superfamily hydrolase
MATTFQAQDELALDPAIAEKAAAIRGERPPKLPSRNVRKVSKATAKAILTAYDATKGNEDERWSVTPTDDVWVSTATGRMVSLLDPQPETITLGDIAHALSMICRFNGHVTRFYSVADHSVHVSKLVPPELAMVGLLHDAAEAYLGDIISPVKKMMANGQSMAFKDAERRLWEAICERFSIDPKLLASVKQADLIALATEKRDLLAHDLDIGCEGVDPDGDLLAVYRGQVRECSPIDSRQRFLQRFQVIRNGREAN